MSVPDELVKLGEYYALYKFVELILGCIALVATAYFFYKKLK